MDNSMKPIYEFSFRTDNYEYHAANAAFYAFRGSGDTYNNLEKLLTKRSKNILEKMIAEENYDHAFVLDIVNANKQKFVTVCKLVRQKIDGVVGMRMIEMDRLMDDYGSLLEDRRETDALLAQYDCVYYSYDRAKDEVTRYRYEDGIEILGCQSLKDWQKDLKMQVADEYRETIDKFISNLQNGVRNIDCSVMRINDDKFFQLTGSAVYDNDVHVKTAGRIGDPNATANREFTRRDQLTGLYLKETITTFAKRRIEELKQKTTLAIIDIDDFKQVNDNYGHSKGDEVLKKCSAIILSQAKDFGKVGRIGGDEFLVVFDKNDDFELLKNVLRGIKNMIFTEYSDEKDGFHVSTSIGLSIYPDDVDGDFATMFQLADCLLYRAKSKGKNRWIVYNPEKHGSVEDVLNNGVKKVGLAGTRGIDKSEFVCKIANMSICGTDYPLDSFFDDVISYFGIERITIYDKTDMKLFRQYGKNLLDELVIEATIDYINDDELNTEYDKGLLVVNNIKHFSNRSKLVYERLAKQGVVSLIHHEITTASGMKYLISYEAVSSNVMWNVTDLHYFRILGKMLETHPELQN